ncbi:hypothetical protein ACQZWC_000056 [Enterobacter bugandensis]
MILIAAYNNHGLLFSAQCYPRLACALNWSLLMQVHQEPRAAPALALAGKRWNQKRMQTHAPDACTAKKKKNT